MKRLRENGYIRMDEDSAITLLPPGEEIAQRIYARHRLLTEFLITNSCVDRKDDDFCTVFAPN